MFFCVTLERPESRIPAVEKDCFLALDCAALPESHACIEYKDNATSMPRWLGIKDYGIGKVYRLFTHLSHSVKANLHVHSKNAPTKL